jgi:hypothetical protein|tara:strand:+ start:420 stop:617 length:198 start_codon:yes stop_codon:yes gene_type:complete
MNLVIIQRAYQGVHDKIFNQNIKQYINDHLLVQQGLIDALGFGVGVGVGVGVGGINSKYLIPNPY